MEQKPHINQDKKTPRKEQKPAIKIVFFNIYF